MALIPCPHCSQTISDQAVACPRCNAVLGTLVTVVAESSAEADAALSRSTQYLANACVWVNRRPWLAAFGSLGVLFLPLLLFVSTRPFDESSEGALAGFGSLLALLSLWWGIWLAMPGSTRSQKWRSVALHVSILLAIVVLLWLLIAVPLSRYLMAIVAVCGIGFFTYRFWRQEVTKAHDAGKPAPVYRWSIYSGRIIVLLGAALCSATNKASPTPVGRELLQPGPQQTGTFPYQRIGGIALILVGLKVVERNVRLACLAELGSESTPPVMTPQPEANPQ